MVDPQLRRVVEGYGILQPRVSVTMASAAGSLFARTYAGHTGVDPYTTAVSDVYQDLFGEGIFTGKGLYDVDAFMASLEGRVPENALLSHDLFEGLHARAALVTDAEVVDDYPSNVLTHAQAAASLGARRLADPVVAVPVGADPVGPRAQPPADHLALEDSRQPAPQPGAAVAGGAVRRRLGVPARPPALLDVDRDGDDVVSAWCRARLELLGGPRKGQGIRVFVRSITRGSRRPISRASACS